MHACLRGGKYAPIVLSYESQVTYKSPRAPKKLPGSRFQRTPEKLLTLHENSDPQDCLNKCVEEEEEDSGEEGLLAHL